MSFWLKKQGKLYLLFAVFQFLIKIFVFVNYRKKGLYGFYLPIGNVRGDAIGAKQYKYLICTLPPEADFNEVWFFLLFV
jgi:hypothetical protein